VARDVPLLPAGKVEHANARAAFSQVRRDSAGMIAPRLIVVRQRDNLIARIKMFRVIGPVLRREGRRFEPVTAHQSFQ
jgi:hypothetical protein